MGFNALDFAILGFFMGIIGLGFFNGISRVTASIIAIYFGAIVSAAFYRGITDFVRTELISVGTRTGQLTIFGLVFLVFSILLTVVLSRWLGDVKLPRRITILDNIGGAALGIVVSGLAMTLAALVLTIMLQAINHVATGGSGPLLETLQDQVRSSSLVPMFLRMAPFFMRSLSPWFPGGLPPILNVVPEA